MFTRDDPEACKALRLSSVNVTGKPQSVVGGVGRDGMSEMHNREGPHGTAPQTLLRVPSLAPSRSDIAGSESKPMSGSPEGPPGGWYKPIEEDPAGAYHAHGHPSNSFFRTAHGGSPYSWRTSAMYDPHHNPHPGHYPAPAGSVGSAGGVQQIHFHHPSYQRQQAHAQHGQPLGGLHNRLLHHLHSSRDEHMGVGAPQQQPPPRHYPPGSPGMVHSAVSCPPPYDSRYPFRPLMENTIRPIQQQQQHHPHPLHLYPHQSPPQVRSGRGGSRMVRSDSRASCPSSPAGMEPNNKRGFPVSQRGGKNRGGRSRVCRTPNAPSPDLNLVMGRGGIKDIAGYDENYKGKSPTPSGSGRTTPSLGTTPTKATTTKKTGELRGVDETRSDSPSTTPTAIDVTANTGAKEPSLSTRVAVAISRKTKRKLPLSRSASVTPVGDDENEEDKGKSKGEMGNTVKP